MKIELAESAGFCFGAQRAVDMVYDLLERGEQAATLGALLHNPQLVAQLEARGVKAVDSPEDVPPGCPRRWRRISPGWVCPGQTPPAPL